MLVETNPCLAEEDPIKEIEVKKDNVFADIKGDISEPKQVQQVSKFVKPGYKPQTASMSKTSKNFSMYY